MASLGLILLTTLILFVTILFYAGLILNFIQPSAVQIQILGIHLSLFGIIVVLSFRGSTAFGFFIGLIGLVTGVFGSFSERNSVKTEEKK